MKIAVIGTGISGLLAAWLLADEHELTVFEANDYIGGHTHTVTVEDQGKPLPVDTGFIVFNRRTYPNFCRLIEQLGVASQASNMSFSVQCERSGLEYCGTSLNTIFAQRRNLLRPAFHRMLRDILRFNRQAPRLLEANGPPIDLQQYLDREGFGQAFIDHYLVPMGSAIWSADPRQMRQFPARYLVQFFHNHGFLSVYDQPQWLTIRGGSQEYVKKLTARFADRIRLRSPITSIRRYADHVAVQPAGGPAERFDQVIIAAHSNQALAMLADPSPQEREILGAIPYQPNATVLHRDAGLMPRTRRAWASWNYHIPREAQPRTTVTYNMNLLQNLPTERTYCVTLNRDEAIDAEKVISRQVYEHPVYTPAGVAAQQRHGQISGVNRTHYCGAYWGYGFHEDGVNSALAVARYFGKELP